MTNEVNPSQKLILCRYSGQENFAVVEIDVPTIGGDDVLVQHAPTSSSSPRLTSAGEDISLWSLWYRSSLSQGGVSG